MSQNKLQTIAELEEKCVDIRTNLLSFIYRIGMGHLGGELSIVEMTVSLYYKYLNFDVMNPHKEGRDRFILSKGHCSETLYTIFSDQGAYTQDYMVQYFESLDTYKFGMHSNRKKCPQIEVSTGSLGHGLPISVGYALGARYLGKNYRIFCMIGDGEFDEGSNWEALMSGGHYKLNNLVCILDKNRLQMTGTTEQVMDIDPVADKVKAFGWNVIEIENGNDMAQVCAVLDQLPERDCKKLSKPTFIISNTVKGKGVSFMEGNCKWHGGGISEEDLKVALADVAQMRKG
ncbi:transketolase [Petroclostridium sp. X23]|uniref:transketolase n=1 Tax=Petroclostridium sp. X23 TaxID=3045146 RepID=UPI0024AE3E49|nr:transketolase [Petroclostridium sp. X23]WHH57169.1 transketolase [Petroclostridium sp. X23]